MTENVLERPHSEGLLSDFTGLLDFLIDPRGAARRLPRKFFWIIPAVLVSIVILVTGLINMPYVQQAMTNQPPPPNVNPEQFQQQMRMGIRMQSVFIYVAPVFMVVVWALSALVIMASSLVIDAKTRFLELFNLMAGLSVIDALKIIATTIVIHMRGEPSGIADLQPALGLDIFVPTDTGKALLGFLGYFNVFNIWQIVMAILIFAAAYRVSKGKASIGVLPLFVLGLIIRVVGAMFQRT
jgi:hypothetical protein